MTTSKIIRSITIAAAAPVLYSVIGLSVVIGGAAPAQSEPTTECSAMAHPPAVQADPGLTNPLTRPGQLGELTQVPAPNSEMPMDCPPIGHG